MVKRFDVVLVALDPTVGSEIAKTRPAVVVSPDVMNSALRTVVVAPLTSSLKNWPSRVTVVFEGRDGSIALDQIRTVDRSRVVRRLGKLADDDGAAALERLREIFAL